MGIKRKFMAGFLAALLLTSQLVLPCSALANNSQPTNQPITKIKSKDEPKKNTKEKSAATPAKDKDSLKNESKSEPSDKKLNSDNSPLKIKPLKELKSQDRSSSSEKRYKHVEMNGLPKEVQMRVDRSSFELASTGDPVNVLVTLTGLKPNSKCSFSVKINEHDPIGMSATADEFGKAKTNFTYILTKSDLDSSIGKFMCSIIFFRGDIADDNPIEEKMGHCNLDISSIIKKDDTKTDPLQGVFIEVLDESGKAITGVTAKDGHCKFKIKLPLGVHIIKVRQVEEKSPDGIKYDTREKTLKINATEEENATNVPLVFCNVKTTDSSIKPPTVIFVGKTPPSNRSFYIRFICQGIEGQEVQIGVDLNNPAWYKNLLLSLWRGIKSYELNQYNSDSFPVIDFPLYPGYYVKTINGKQFNLGMGINAEDLHSIEIGYRATGELECIASIKIPNEKYSGCFEAGLLDEQGHVVISAVNDENGNFNFEKIKYTEKDVGGHKYQNYIKYTDKGLKLKGALGEIKSDESIPYLFPITVKDNGDGTLSLSTENGTLSRPISSIKFVFSPAYLTSLLPITGTPLTLLIISVLVFTTTLVVLTRNHSKVVEIKSKN